MNTEKIKINCPECSKEIVLFPEQQEKFTCPHCGSEYQYNRTVDVEKELKKEVKPQKISTARTIAIMALAFVSSFILTVVIITLIFEYTSAEDVNGIIVFGATFALMYYLMKRSKKMMYFVLILMLLGFAYDIMQDDSFFLGMADVIRSLGAGS